MSETKLFQRRALTSNNNIFICHKGRKSCRKHKEQINKRKMCDIKLPVSK